MVEKVMNCGPWGLTVDLKGIAKICMGCKSLNFSKDTGFSCGWEGWTKRALGQTCSVCGKTFEENLGAYFGKVEGTDYWECPDCNQKKGFD